MTETTTATPAPKKHAPRKVRTFRPEELATRLGVSGKVLRAWLRANHARPATAKGTSWIVPERVAKEAAKHFKQNRAK